MISLIQPRTNNWGVAYLLLESKKKKIYIIKNNILLVVDLSLFSTLVFFLIIDLCLYGIMLIHFILLVITQHFFTEQVVSALATGGSLRWFQFLFYLPLFLYCFCALL